MNGLDLVTDRIRSAPYDVLRTILKEARTKAGLEQSDVGALVGKEQSYISRIERGGHYVEIVEFFRLATALKLDPAAVVKQMYDVYEEAE